MILAENEIIHLRKKTTKNINDIKRIEDMILAGQKTYWKASKEMEEAIHKFVCLSDAASKKERKECFRQMEEKVKHKKNIEKIHKKEVSKVKDFAEIYKQNLIDIVNKIKELEYKSSELGYEMTIKMHEFDNYKIDDSGAGSEENKDLFSGEYRDIFYKRYQEKSEKVYSDIVEKLNKIKISPFIKYEPVRYTTTYGDQLSKESFTVFK